MRVVHITTVPESLIGFLNGLLEYLTERGTEVSAITSSGPHLDKFKREHPSTPVWPIDMSRKITPLSDLRALGKLARTLRRIKPDIVHAHTPKGGLLGMLAARAARVPIRIYHMRGLPLETAAGLQRRVLWLAERTSCALATQVLCVSESLRQSAIAEALVAPEKVAVLANGSGQGVDAVHRFSPDRVSRAARHEIRARYNVPDDAIVIGFIGRLVRDKGVEELAAAWATLREAHPNVHLLVVGATEDRDGISPAIARTFADDPRAHVVGFDWDIVPLYAAMDIVVLPTYREGFPNVALEAAAMRLPVVATRVSGCVDAVVDGSTGQLVRVRDSRSLAEALRRYIVDDASRAAHGLAARERVIRDFRPALLHEATYELYRRLRASTPRPQGIVKRVFDVSLASTALLALSPVIGLSALAIRITMGSPVLFRHVRPGRGGKLFTLYKFRTMRAPREGEGVWFRTDEERLTWLGRFLRKSSIDELPGLFNVVKGDMSLVGPRPLLTEYLERYTPEQHRRHAVRPGITGWAQINGRQTLKFSKRIEYDLWYVDNWSLRLDLRILVRTVWRVFTSEGVIPGQDVDDVDDLGLAPDRPAPRVTAPR